MSSTLTEGLGREQDSTCRFRSTFLHLYSTPVLYIYMFDSSILEHRDSIGKIKYRQIDNRYNFIEEVADSSTASASGLVVKSIVAIDGPRVRFAAGALRLFFFFCIPQIRIEITYYSTTS